MVLIIGVSLTVIFLVNRSPSLQNVVNRLANTGSGNTNTGAPVAPTNTVIVSPDRQTITYVARNFAERFGSGSSENGGSNLLEAKAYATNSYQEYLDDQVAAIRARPPVAYTGTVTRALAFDFLQLNTLNASVVVSTQQTTTTDAGAKTSTRDLLVDLVKVDGEWKVNAAAWK